MVLLEAGNDAQVGLAIRAVVLGLSPKYPPVRVRRVPAVIAAQGRALPGLGAVSKLVELGRCG